jgi:23S rRNA pseudouridine2605 synthase
MSRAGLCSRRDAERWIEEGRVKLNGEILTSPAVTVTDQSDIEVDGVPLPAIGQPRLFRFHKPKGYLTAARDPEGRKTIADLIPAELPRLMPIGRLDMNSEGLLLLTTDGALKRQLELPSTGWQRRYRVRVHGDIDEDKLAKLSDGITIEGFDYGPIEATLERAVAKNAWLNIALREGKNREIRRVMEHFGWPVNRLIRVSFGPFHLGKLPKADIDEVKTKVVKEQIGLVLQSTTDTSQRKRRLASTGKKKKAVSGQKEATPSRDAQRSAKPLGTSRQRRLTLNKTFDSKAEGSDKTAEKTTGGAGRSDLTPKRARARQKPVRGARSRPAR